MSLFSPDVTVDNQVLLDPSSTISVSNFPATQPISATSLPLPTGAATDAAVLALTKPSDTQLVDGSAHTQPVSGTVSITGTVGVTTGNATTSTIAQQTISSNTNTTLLSANANRQKIVVFATKGTLYIKLGATAATSSFTYALTSANSTLEIVGWGGQVDCLSSVNGNIVTVTELV